ncbi:MAG: hypothetical protein Ta2F_17110 [Termitinemataceae bacterium]|nr:MAG: hypothetical protein Ta2F_17110 [Termitinemataceae bacterium]
MENILESVKIFISNIYNKFQNLRSGEHHDMVNLIMRLGLAVVIIIFQIILLKQTWRLARWADKKMRKYFNRKIDPKKSKKLSMIMEKLDKLSLLDKIKNLSILDPKHIIKALSFAILLARWVLAVLQLLFITLPLIFGLFEPTRGLATRLLGHILNPLKSFALAFWNYIPNIFAIVIILFIVRYVMKAMRFFTKQIADEKIKIHGFFSDWAVPTYNILRVVVIAFTIALVFPYLPNSDSNIFKGVSALVAVLFSLGSSSIIGNVIAGIVMTYMRPFKIGDRIQINGITGFVVEKGGMVTRIRTHKNEFITIPNSMILSTSVTNYHTSANEGQDGLIVYIRITMGYDVPWRKVHEILLNAALKSEHILKEPKPFINQVALDDFYGAYELNAYTKDVHMLPRVYSEVYTNIQDGFFENGISLFAPHYQVQKHVEKI